MDIRTNRKELRVNMDYMEQRLFDLYDKYLYSYDELRKRRWRRPAIGNTPKAERARTEATTAPAP